MIVKCCKCNLEYDDFDHWTTCPHEWFPDPKELQIEHIYDYYLEKLRIKTDHLE